jgi:hypothetical protein
MKIKDIVFYNFIAVLILTKQNNRKQNFMF